MEQYNNLPDQKPLPVYDPVHKARSAVIFGIVGICLSPIPVFGLILGGIGISEARTGLKSSAKKKAETGLALSITAMALSLLLSFVIGFIMGLINFL